MPAVSASWSEAARGYLRTRFPARLFLPCAGFLLLAGYASGRPLSPGQAVPDLVLSLALLLQFRIMDDLADLERDRTTHPERVLVRSLSLVPFHVMLGGSALAGAALVSARPERWRGLAFLAALDVAAWLWYRLRPRRCSRVLGYHVVLAKYPAFVWLLGGCRGDLGLLLACCAVYLTFLIYEPLHDRSLDREPMGTAALSAAFPAFSLVAVLMAAEVAAKSQVLASLQGGIACAALAAGINSRRLRREGSPRYAVFVAGIVLVTLFSIGVRS